MQPVLNMFKYKIKKKNRTIIEGNSMILFECQLVILNAMLIIITYICIIEDFCVLKLSPQTFRFFLNHVTTLDLLNYALSECEN